VDGKALRKALVEGMPSIADIVTADPKMR